MNKLTIIIELSLLMNQEKIAILMRCEKYSQYIKTMLDDLGYSSHIISRDYTNGDYTTIILDAHLYDNYHECKGIELVDYWRRVGAEYPKIIIVSWLTIEQIDSLNRHSFKLSSLLVTNCRFVLLPNIRSNLRIALEI